MKTLEDLVNTEDSFFRVMKEWISDSKNQVTLLSPADSCDRILIGAQVTTRSILGTLIYHTGGVLIDHGWIRILGSGNESFPRNVHSWNNESKESGLYLIADDAAGGFYAINGGAFSGEMNTIYYWAPDSMEWEALDLKFSEFFCWLLSGDLDSFYEGIRWENWRNDIKNITTDQCVSFYPFLWTEEGGCNTSNRDVVPISEALALKYDLSSQLQQGT
jgi:hypothetical protein